jgi:hypothetical protein
MPAPLEIVVAPRAYAREATFFDVAKDMDRLINNINGFSKDTQ